MTTTQTRKSGWDVLVRWSAYADAALFAAAAIGLRDKEAAAAAVGMIVGLVLLRVRGGKIGLVVLGLLFANSSFWSVTGAWSNLAHGESFLHTMLPSLFSALSLAGLVSAIAAVLPRRSDTAFARGPRAVAVGAIVLVLAALIGTFVAPSPVKAQSGDVLVVTKNTKFVPVDMEARGGTVAVFVSNQDLFWHTFTIHKLHVNLNIPVGGHRRIEFQASPGTYEIVCVIHEQGGMKGTLVVR